MPSPSSSTATASPSPATPTPAQPATDRKPRSRALPTPKSSGNLQQLTPAQLANARAKAEMLVARAVAGELAFNKDKLMQQLQNQQVVQNQLAQKAAAQGGVKSEQQQQQQTRPAHASMADVLASLTGGASGAGAGSAQGAFAGMGNAMVIPAGSLVPGLASFQQQQQGDGSGRGVQLASAEAVEAALKFVRTRVASTSGASTGKGSETNVKARIAAQTQQRPMAFATPPLFFAPVLPAGENGKPGSVAGFMIPTGQPPSQPLQHPQLVRPGGAVPHGANTALLTQLGMMAPPGFSEADAASFAMAMSAAAQGLPPAVTHDATAAAAATAAAPNVSAFDEDDMLGEDLTAKPRYRLGSMRIADPETGEKKYVCPGCNKEYKNANG
ncbi:hypothetical protein HDU67_005282, partial [Dinochytrium kinnereticum]